MQGIERIVSRIQEEAVEEAKQIEEKARAQAVKLMEDADREADKVDAEKASEADAAADDIRRRAESTARLNTQKASLAARQEILTEVFARALTLLRTMDQKQYAAFLAKLIVKNAKGGEVVWFANRDMSLSAGVVKAANESLTKMGKQPVTCGGANGSQEDGIILKQGPVSTNCTLESLLREARPALTGEVAAMLF